MYQIELQYSNDSFMIIPYPLFRVIMLFIRYECISTEFPGIFVKNYIDIFNTQHSTVQYTININSSKYLGQ